MKKKAVLDGVCNPVRNVSALKRYGRGCKPRPAQMICRMDRAGVGDLSPTSAGNQGWH
jgi:hypothetical protein